MFASSSSLYLLEKFRIKYIRYAFRMLTNVYAGAFCEKTSIVLALFFAKKIKSCCISGCTSKFTEATMILQILRDIVTWGGALEMFSYEIVAKVCFTQKVLEKTRFKPVEKLFQG